MDEREPAPRELLAKAIQLLDRPEREQVTSWLLARTFREPQSGHPVGVGVAALRETRDQLVASLGGGGRRGEHQVVPIRLPSDQHAALRDWCAEHGFTMATVVRGLVERFLEERGQLPGRAA